MKLQHEREFWAGLIWGALAVACTGSITYIICYLALNWR